MVPSPKVNLPALVLHSAQCYCNNLDWSLWEDRWRWGEASRKTKPEMTAHGQNNLLVIRLERGRNTDNQPLPRSILAAIIFLERSLGENPLLGNSQSGYCLSLGAKACSSHRTFFHLPPVLASPTPYFPWTSPLLEVHIISQGETTWILKAQVQCLWEHMH